MRTALLSDVHANLQALEACLAHARDGGVGRLAFLGDHVGYGANPREVLDVIMEAAAQGAIVLQGNHDALALDPVPDVTQWGQVSAAWTGAQLREAHRGFLRDLPLTAWADLCFFVHASADAPAQWRYVHDERVAEQSLAAACALEPRTRYVLGGHVHRQSLYYRGAAQRLMPFAPTPGVAVPVPAHRQWLATVGSVGQPRDGHAQAMYAVLDHAQSCLTFHRVDYDCASAAAAIRRAGLPDYFAQRLEEGR